MPEKFRGRVENEVLKKIRSSKKLEENEVKYSEFAMSNFAALLRVGTKILAQ